MAFATLVAQLQGRKSSSYVANAGLVAPSQANWETNPASLQEDMNILRSAVANLIDGQASEWYTDLILPSAIEVGTQRGVNDLNVDLHAREVARRLVRRSLLVDVVVSAAQNWEILQLGELPANTTAAVGAVTTKGTVVAHHAGTFGTHSLDEVAGSNALRPKNLVTITDGSGDPILSGGRLVHGLLQSETVTDGHTLTGTSTTRAQISFVRPNAGLTDLEAVPVIDIENLTIRYGYVERIAVEDEVEQDFLSQGAAIDIGAGSGTITRQVAYDNQGATPVDQTTNAILDLEGAGLSWLVRDDLEANLLGVVEGSAGGTSQVNIYAGVDEYDNDAAVVDFAQGVTIGSGLTTPIDIGVSSPNTITSQSGPLKMSTSGGFDLLLDSTLEMRFSDTNLGASGWAATSVKLSESLGEWDTYSTNFGEVSLLNAINQAGVGGGVDHVTGFATTTGAVSAGTDVGGSGGGANLDAQLPDLSVGTFIDAVKVYLNGVRLITEAAVSGGGDVYPGTSLALGQLKFEGDLETGWEIIAETFAP